MEKSAYKSLTIAYLAIVMVMIFGVENTLSAEYSFPRTLKQGVSGEDVRELQRVLNIDPETRVSEAGPGSPGQETAYFGALTRQAVVRFQEKYSSEILTPLNLNSGTGIAGSRTLAMMTEIGGVMAGKQSPFTTSIANIPLNTTNQVSTSTPINPNLKNLDKFLDSIDRVAIKKNVPAADTLIIKHQIIKDAATTTDLRATFVRIVEERNTANQAAREGSFTGNAFAYITNTFKKALGIKEASAVTDVPFGGELIYPYFCTCSFTWLIDLTPLPPSYAVLLSYTPFSQAYLTYNIPYTTWLLGKYSTGGQCVTFIYPTCVTIPMVEGMITPTVGSSAI